MNYQRLTEEQKGLRAARLWIMSKASQIQADKRVSRSRAISMARVEWGRILAWRERQAAR